MGWTVDHALELVSENLWTRSNEGTLNTNQQAGQRIATMDGTMNSCSC